jgi:fructose-bisphosphate aldolase class II
MDCLTARGFSVAMTLADEGRYGAAVNVASTPTVNAALRGFSEAEGDGIVQISVGGAEYSPEPASGTR